MQEAAVCIWLTSAKSRWSEFSFYKLQTILTLISSKQITLILQRIWVNLLTNSSLQRFFEDADKTNLKSLVQEIFLKLSITFH